MKTYNTGDNKVQYSTIHYFHDCVYNDDIQQIKIQLVFQRKKKKACYLLKTKDLIKGKERRKYPLIKIISIKNKRMRYVS